MASYRILLWGNSVDFDLCKHHIWYQAYCCELDIVGFACNETLCLASIDGVPVLGIESLASEEYDFLIDMNHRGEELCEQILEKLQVPRRKIIPARVLELPGFSLEEYAYLLQHPVTIVAPNCWGGFTYNSLGLSFDSPFINTRIYREDYYRLLGDLREYLELPLEYVGWQENKEHPEASYPLMRLGDVEIHFMHYHSPEEALEKWEARKMRMHWENLLVADYLETEEEWARFAALPYGHKVGFTSVREDFDPFVAGDRDAAVCEGEAPAKYLVERIHVPFDEKTPFHYLYDGQMNAFMYLQGSKKTDVVHLYDVLKLLNHRPDYRRCE